MKDKNAWSLDSYIAKQIAEGTKKLLDWKHGHPPSLTYEEWLMILKKINHGFWKYYAREEEGTFKDFNEQLEWINGPEWREAKELFIRWFEHLWD